MIRRFIEDHFSSFEKLAIWGFNTGIYIALSGLFTSRFALSMGSIVMGCACLLYLFTQPLAFTKKRFTERKFLLFAVLITLSVVTAFIGSESTEFAWTRLRLYAAFLLIPLIAGFHPPITHMHLKRYLLFSIFGATFTSLLVLSPLITEFHTIYDNLSKGQAIPTPISHIRYGMFICFTTLSGILLLLKGKLPLIWRRWTLVCTTFLFFTIFLLSVRTAWALTCIGIFSLIIYLAKDPKYRLAAFTSVMIFVGSMYAAYLYIPTVHVKVRYMIHDLHQYNSGNGKNYSDSERLFSMQNGYDLWTQNRWLGVGSGDMHEAVFTNATRLQLPAPTIPHNQFLFTAVCGGLVSLILFATGYIFMLYARVSRKKFGIWLFYLLYTVAMIVEPVFETSEGVLSFVLLANLLMMYAFIADVHNKNIVGDGH